MIDGRDPTPEQELVERLLRLAGADTEIPAHGADKIRETVRPLWRRECRARAARRRLVIALPVAAALAVALAVGVLTDRRAPARDEPVAAVEVVQGTIEIDTPSGGPRQASSAAPAVGLEAGSRVRTGGSSRVCLRLANGQSLRLDHASEVRLATALTVELDAGAVYVDSGGVSDAAVLVRTPMAEVREVGTRFEVRRSGAGLLVRVRGGRVLVAARGQQHEVPEGEALALDAHGGATRDQIRTHGPEWSWTQSVAPPFAIDGRTAEEFLAWASDETGLRVEYRNARIESLVAGTVLHGEIRGLAPDEALEVVMASCGLKATRVGSTVVVEDGGAPPAAADRRPVDNP